MTKKRSNENTLASLREARGLHQRDIAKALGVHQSVVSRREKSGPHITITKLQEYAQALGDTCEIVFISKRGHRMTVNLATALRF